MITTAAQLREKYLQFFQSKGHAVIRSASLVILATYCMVIPRKSAVSGILMPSANRHRR